MAASTALKSPSPGPATLEGRDEANYTARFLASVDAGLADAEADDVMDTEELEAWLAARRRDRLHP